MAQGDRASGRAGHFASQKPHVRATGRPRPAPRPRPSLLGTSIRCIPWNELLLRVFREDILACPCGGRREVIAIIDEKPVIERILGHLGLPTTGPPTAPARLPTLAEVSL